MVTIDCPWCTEDILVAFGDLEDLGASFTCADCGTTFALVEDEPAPFDLAA